MMKKLKIKTKLHQPRHIYADDTVTFISASTYQKASYLDTAYKKSYLLTKIKEILSEFGYQFYAWVILDNHYHILFKTKMGKDLGKVIRTIHGNSSHHFNKLEDNGSGKAIGIGAFVIKTISTDISTISTIILSNMDISLEWRTTLSPVLSIGSKKKEKNGFTAPLSNIRF